RRRHTISKRDWSSDVCSSDLSLIGGGASLHDDLIQLGVLDVIVVVGGALAVVDLVHVGVHSGLPSGSEQLSGTSLHLGEQISSEIGRASCRGRKSTSAVGRRW